MADKNMNDSPNLPGTGQTAAKDRTGQGYSARADSRTLRVNCTPVEADPTRHGALGKTDVNLGQDTPVDAGAEGLNLNDLDDEKAA